MKFYKNEIELMVIFNRAFLNLTFVENCSKCSINANINYTLRVGNARCKNASIKNHCLRYSI
ncbi:hypothetical protein H311_00542 [Anncaliia algerae PRA109]|nr:hypothetical protein H311_00542 [Anncaliia algerae PRA109]